MDMLKSIKVIVLVMLLIVLGLIIGPVVFAQQSSSEQPQAQPQEQPKAAASTDNTNSWVFFKWIAAAFAVGMSTIAGGLAVGRVGAAAMAAMGGNPDVAGKAIPYVGLAEGICLWGFIVALMILLV